MTAKPPRYRITATAPEYQNGTMISERVLWWAARRDILQIAQRHARRQKLHDDPSQEVWRMTTHLQSPIRVGGHFVVKVGDTTVKLERLY